MITATDIDFSSAIVGIGVALVALIGLGVAKKGGRTILSWFGV